MTNEVLTTLIDTGTTFTTQQAVLAGVTKRQLNAATSDGQITRLQRGIYVSPNSLADPFVVVQGQHPKGIFSLDTALALFDLTDSMFYEYHVTFPKGYHVRESHDLRIIDHYATKRLYESDRKWVETPRGNRVLSFSPERSLVDAWRLKVGANLELGALSQYLNSELCNLAELNDVIDRVGHSSRLKTALETLINA